VSTYSLSGAELGFVRVAVASPELKVGDTAFNAAAIEAAVRAAAVDGAVLVATPELGLTGYTAGDLFFSDHLIEQSWSELRGLVQRLSDLSQVAVVVGLPVRVADGRVYNCAAMLGNGLLAGIVAKQYLPNRAEFYEDRWFVRALGTRLPSHVGGDLVPFGTDLVFGLNSNPNARVGIEICEDLWAVEPPSGPLALAGATIIVNPSGSPDQLGKAPYRRDLVRQQSARCLAAYLYAGSGPGESTMDVVFGGHSLIAENGGILAETERFKFDTQIAIADIDTQRLLHERHMNSSFANAPAPGVRWVEVPLEPSPTAPQGIKRPVARLPFVPSNPDQRSANCEEIFSIQATGLAKRLRHTGSKASTIGISGGLDSTLALLVMVRAFDTLGLDRSGITAITMPGFGTTDRTYQNALGLMRALGTSVREIPIADAVRAHFADIGHHESDHDVVYENAQARERTQILMDVANEIGGFVVGTGDLSEAALGWMTFNGDHMSMYHVNAGVPKTLVRYLVSWAADAVFDGEARRILHDVVDTPITPELLPLKEGKLEQKTEDTVGPYELHDFFLFHVVRYGSRPSKVFALARHAFQTGEGTQYDDATILKWLETFHRRFFTQQFKRSSMPDGPKVGSVALSPRGDWRMPSDASGATWLAEIALVKASLAPLPAE
jgi:NAD+ synthase (glutamine-hydrolysing)